MWLIQTLILFTLSIVQNSFGETNCPPDSKIDPCICFEDEGYLFLECNHIRSDEQLAIVFEQTFPSNEFEELIIVQNGSVQSLNRINEGTFGSVTFRNIRIEGTSLRYLDGSAFSRSKDRLQSLRLYKNDIDDTDIFRYLTGFTKLKSIDLTQNNIITFQELISGTLQILSISYNPAIRFSANFTSMAYGLTVLDASHCDFQGLAESSFIGAPNIQELFLSFNSFITLPQHMISFDNPTLRTLTFESNKIEKIEEGFLSGSFNETLYVSMKNNSITTVDEFIWKPLIEKLIDEQSIDLAENPLDCGCDIAWLVSDPQYMNKFTRASSCLDGTSLYDVDSSYYASVCP